MVSTIEEILVAVGGFGKAQLLYIIAIFSAFGAGSWSMILIAFSVRIPEWHCADGMLPSQNLSSFLDSHTNGSALEEACSANGSSCSSFYFGDDENTIINEWNLVCGLKWIPSIIISIQMGGVLVGALLAGQIGERYGRRNCLMWASVFHFTVTLLAAFVMHWQVFAVFRFLIGVGIGGIFTNCFTYAMEFLPVKTRGPVAIMPYWTVGVAVFVVAAYFLRDWRQLHLGCAIFNAPCILAYFFVPESIRWLTVEGRIDEAMDALARVARLNGKPVPKNARGVLETIHFQRKTESQVDKQYGYVDLIRNPSLRKITLVLCFIWCTMSFISYGVTFGAASLDTSVYLAILLTNSVEIPGLFPVLLMMDKLGRRWTTVAMFGIIFVANVILLGLNISGWEQDDTVLLLFALLMKLCVDNVWNVVQAWTSELYPTVTRALGYGLSATSARVGGMLAPFLIDFNTRLVLTYVVITGFSLTVILLTVTMPETNKAEMKDVIIVSSADSSSVEMEMRGDSSSETEGEEGERKKKSVDEEEGEGRGDPCAVMLIIDGKAAE